MRDYSGSVSPEPLMAAGKSVRAAANKGNQNAESRNHESRNYVIRKRGTLLPMKKKFPAFLIQSVFLF
jgi:hypothetical protein